MHYSDLAEIALVLVTFTPDEGKKHSSLMKISTQKRKNPKAQKS